MQPIRLISGVVAVGGWTLMSRLLGFVRDMLIAGLLGPGVLMDAYVAAFRLPNMFRRFFAEGAFNAAFVPMFSKRLEAGEGAEEFAGQALSGLALVLLALSGLAMVFMPALVFATAEGFWGDERFDITVEFGRIVFPYIFFISLAALFSGVLNAAGRFAAAAAAPVLLNVMLVVAMTAAWALGGAVARALVWTIPFAGVAQLGLVWAAAARAGVRAVSLPHRQELEPQAAGRGQGRAAGEGRQSALRGDLARQFRAGRAGFIRGFLLRPRRDGEPHQGAAVGLVRPPHVDIADALESDPFIFFLDRVLLARSAARVGAGRDEDGAGAVLDDPPAAARDRGAGQADGAQDVDFDGHGTSGARVVRGGVRQSGAGAAAGRLRVRTGARGTSAGRQAETGSAAGPGGSLRKTAANRLRDPARARRRGSEGPRSAAARPAPPPPPSRIAPRTSFRPFGRGW